ncbi:MAG TPA: TIGR04013 family B12-binding domain/radical SAM domain-containing protein [Myxococcota bacterium]|nr:TIGR04013 family B12-binding domain/radical SAM domain-containing protein [Myxococcota bacterium]HRY95612.1 TIGR04013 family B12-binding domain/radical SAM domain-containing protein [Myxococcota bacterium]HSA20131.1 TIGR04013 family B12-binding domain/radical SAM domain-containing protein [Myxococcota bacterium]
MRPVFALRVTPRNRNSWPSVATALLGAEAAQALDFRVLERPGELPDGTRALAFSFVTPELEGVAREVRALRASHPGLWLLAGGAHASADPEGTLALGFDAVVAGEGEQAAQRLCGALAAGGPPPTGVWRSEALLELDQSLHVEPRLGLFPFAEISRGCPCGCAFCVATRLFGRRMRHRSPQVVAAGVALAARAGYHRFRFLSPDAFSYLGRDTLERRAALEELLVRCFEAGASQLMLGCFPSEVRPDRVEPELLALLRARCLNRTVVIGAQAGSDRVLGLMHRGHTVEASRRAVRLAHEADLVPLVDVMFGFPGEAPEDRQASLAFIEECLRETRALIHAHVYMPLPGSAAWPAAPEPVEDRVWAALEAHTRTGRLEGDWRKHQRIGARILRWREEGLIRV